MSIESAKSFINRMKTDDAFAKRLSEAATREERVSILQGAGYKFTKKEFLDLASELSDAELSGVAGGVPQALPINYRGFSNQLMATGALGYKCDTFETTSECIC